jgi:hypothetical protein
MADITAGERANKAALTYYEIACFAELAASRKRLRKTLLPILLPAAENKVG